MKKKAAMEMSVGTIVTIVLLMTVLVLGIFLVQRIFFVGTNAVDSIGTEVENEIQKLFADEGKRVAIYPTSRDVKMKKGGDPAGFAFSVRNTDPEEARFSYSVTAQDVSNCGDLRESQAENFLIGGEGSFSLGSGDTLQFPRLVKLDLPETAPVCTLTYNLEILKDREAYSDVDIFVTIK